jgi:hypothetical protein
VFGQLIVLPDVENFLYDQADGLSFALRRDQHRLQIVSGQLELVGSPEWWRIVRRWKKARLRREERRLQQRIASQERSIERLNSAVELMGQYEFGPAMDILEHVASSYEAKYSRGRYSDTLTVEASVASRARELCVQLQVLRRKYEFG